MARLRFVDFRLFGAVGLFALGSPLIQADDSPVLNQTDEDLAKRVGMPFLNENGMSGVAAQGIRDDYNYLIGIADGSGPVDQAPEKGVMALFQSVLPMLDFLTDYEITEIEYHDPAAPQVVTNTDGTITVLLPKRLGQIAYHNMAIKGLEETPLGDLFFNDVTTVEGSKLILTPRGM
ncbi:hypothetical protein [Thalassolituus sp.]|jgi:hypothetical protein|uniref:hypothetical protein n=1 Tax=Thalassolituus sp. TaxID=2030822 RepID=UPI002A8168BF|nr:hypothetical protein [Thalassolituus sp.]|tara:strand:+ start:1666 stop:2196 length:531 start_codon:yes stop_codon:yes gene_type:complete